MCALETSLDGTFAQDCSAALQYCFELMERCPPFPGPWQPITPSATCRQTVAEPACFLERLQGRPDDPLAPGAVAPQRRYDDSVLRAINILCGRAEEEPHLNRRLYGLGRYVFAVRDPSGQFIVDLLTPFGLLSGNPCGAYSVLIPEPGSPLVDVSRVLGTTSTREAALLLSLGYPTVVFRKFGRSTALDIRNFWAPRWTAVPGCQPLLDRNAVKSRLAQAAASWVAGPGVPPEPATIQAVSQAVSDEEIHADIHEDRPCASADAGTGDNTHNINNNNTDIITNTIIGGSATASTNTNPHDKPPESSSAAVEGADVVPAEVAVASEDSQPVAQNPRRAFYDLLRSLPVGPTPGVIARHWRLADDQTLYRLDCLMGGSLIGLSDAVPLQVTQTFACLQEALRRHNSEKSLPMILLLAPADMEILQGLLAEEHPLEGIQEELAELLLVCRKPPQEVWPSRAEQFIKPAARPTVAEARQALLQALADANKSLPLQQVHDQFEEAVDREVVEPLRNAAAGEHRSVVQSVQLQYAEAVRNVTIIEPYAVHGSIPRYLEIDVPFDRKSPAVAHRNQQQQVLTVLKMLNTLTKRR
jgi:hypothetical protein